MASIPLVLLVSSLLLLLPASLENPNLLHDAEEPFRDPDGPFSIVTYNSIWHDYSPPAPPPPPPSPEPSSASCEADVGGVGDFDTRCELLSSVELKDSVYIKGKGSLVLLAGVSLTCPITGCEIYANLSGEVQIGSGAQIMAGRVVLAAWNVSLANGTVVNVMSLAGKPPDRTSGVPSGIHGDGGGYGGRRASCYVKDGQTQEDSWGGDAYSWDTLDKPDSYGSKGGSTSLESDYGGGGGGRVWLEVKELLEVEGDVLADGGDGGDKGGGGSGGSIYIQASRM